MADKMVPMRKMSVYQTDDGRRIEAFDKVSDVKFDTRSDETDENSTFEQKPTVYVGSVPVMTNKGPREIKFEINDFTVDGVTKDVTTVEEAFAGFFASADKTMEELNKKQQEMQEQMREPRIIAAPAQALQDLDNMEDEEESPRRIII